MNRKEDKQKRGRTKESMNQKGQEPKRTRTKKSTNQKEQEPKRAHLYYNVRCGSVLQEQIMMARVC